MTTVCLWEARPGPWPGETKAALSYLASNLLEQSPELPLVFCFLLRRSWLRGLKNNKTILHKRTHKKETGHLLSSEIVERKPWVGHDAVPEGEVGISGGQRHAKVSPSECVALASD